MSETQMYRGILAQRNFAGIVWVLETPQETFELRGPLDALAEGCQVEVEAVLAQHGFGFNMVGPVLEVRAIQVLSAPRSTTAE
jgi:hypothetical protein